MATINAIGVSIPVPVNKGGTGNNTLTTNGVLRGNGTSALSVSTAGTTGTLFVKNAISLFPDFYNYSDGSFTFSTATAGITRTVFIENTSNTANSSSSLKCITGGSSGGDPYTLVAVSANKAYLTGVSNVTNDSYMIGGSSLSLAGSPNMIITKAGEITKPFQSAFLAYLNADIANKTGNGSANVTANTEVFDQNSDYNSVSGVFTAPTTGIYMIIGQITLSNIATGAWFNINLISSNRSYYSSYKNTAACKASSDKISVTICALCDMDAGDAIYMSITSTGEAGNTQTVVGHATNLYTFFSGYLAC